MQEAKEYLENIFEHSVDGMIVFGFTKNVEEPIVVRVSRAFENMFGYTKEEMVGKTLKMLLPLDYPRIKRIEKKR